MVEVTAVHMVAAMLAMAAMVVKAMVEAMVDKDMVAMASTHHTDMFIKVA